jgi:P-type Cu2+ transporter
VPKASEVSNITGEGIVARVGGQDIRIVSPGHLARQGNAIAHDSLKRLEGQGKTVVVLVRDGTPRALFALADIVRPESKEAIAELKSLGISSIMLTGGVGGTRHHRVFRRSAA